MMVFDESKHARGTGAQGGQFVSKGASSEKDTVGFDARAGSGAGYGAKGGDKRVRELQSILNNLGFTDAAGKPLKLDGKLGPKTTAAIKRLQRKMGLKADGKVTPQMLTRLRKVDHARHVAYKSGKKGTRDAALASLAPPRKRMGSPAKKATAAASTAKKAAPARVAAKKAVPRKAAPATVKRYSTGMTDGLERHGTHNQKSHGNRLGKSTNIPGKTGLGSSADKARKGTNRVRLDDEIKIVQGTRNYLGGRNVLFGRKGRVRSIEDDQVHVQLDGDREGNYKVIRKDNLEVTRTAQEMDREDRAKLDQEVKEIRKRSPRKAAR